MTHLVDHLPNFHAVVRHWAQRRPDRVAFHFMPDGESVSGVLSFADLDARARALAAVLQARGWRGEPLLLQYRPGLDFIVAFFGCLYAGAIAVPAYPPTNNRSKSTRLQALVASCGARAVLTDAATAADLERDLDGSPMPLLRTDTIDLAAAVDWVDDQIDASGVAFLQYSSGSTGDPKGVVITHGNLMHNQQTIRRAMGNGDHTVFASWLPLFHDMGLVGNVMQPLYLGVSCHLMPPMAFMQKPRRWLDVISRHGVTCTGGPNFAFDLCVDKIPPEDRAGLDLSRWDVAYNGSEPVRAETLRRFADAFRPHGLRDGALYPCYGLAEGTLLVSGPQAGGGFRTLAVDGDALAAGQARSAQGASAQEIVSCGPVANGQDVRIVDPQTQRTCEDGRVGELWLHGPSISAGYWRRPDADAALFAEPQDLPGSGRHCRTGDLGFFRNGELHVTGRLKELLIVRGRNHYPQDIEASVQSAWPGFQRSGGAAFLDGERLVLVQEVTRTALRGYDAAQAGRLARAAIAEHHGLALAELVAIRPATLAKTSSGKIRRGAARDAYRAGELARVDAASPNAAPAPIAAGTTSSFAVLRDTIAGLGVPLAAIVPEATVYQLGLDSLRLVELHERLGRALGSAPPIEAVFDAVPLSDLAARLDVPAATPQADAPAGPPSDALTPYQVAIWLRQLQTPEPIYNLAVALEFDAGVEPVRIEQAFAALVARHRHLRQCVGHDDDGAPHWRDAEPPRALRVDAAAWSEARLDAGLRAFRAAAFMLEDAAPVRASVFLRSGQGPLLALCVHHVATDFAGATALVDELVREVASAGVAPTVDARAAQGQLAAAAASAAEADDAWLDRLASASAGIDLGVSLAGADDLDHEADAQHFGMLDADLMAGLREACARTGATLNVLLAAAFGALLHRYSGQASLCLGMPFSVRPLQLAAWPGSAVNMVPVDLQFGDGDDIAALVRRTMQGVALGLRHRFLPLTRVAEGVRRRDPGRQRLFDAVFICQAEPRGDDAEAGRLLAGSDAWLAADRWSGLRVRSRRIASTAAQALLTLLVFPSLDGAARLSLEFDRARVPQAFAGRILSHYVGLLQAFLRTPDAPLHALAYLPEPELRRQWLGWNTGGREALPLAHDGSTLATLFLDAAAAQPSAQAVVDSSGAAWSYAELRTAAQRIRATLSRHGVGPGDCVGVALPRDRMLPAAILGVLMAGAAYVPLDLDYPGERLRHIFEASGARHVLTLPAHAGDFARAGALCVFASDAETPDASPLQARADDVAYVLFTSGSTGQPKGVQVTHRNVAALLHWARDTFDETERARVLASTSICFDLSVFEFFVPLCLGTTCVVVPGILDLVDAAPDAVTMINTVPSAIEALLGAGALPASVTTALVAGEPFRQPLVDRLYRESRVRRVLDLYGPTEDTVYSTGAERRLRGRETIGRPLPGTRAYVLDTHGQPVPVGLPGELHLAGAGLSLGYRGRDDLTRAAFVLPPALAHLETRAYRTGDIVRLAEDGEIVYLGRRDQQVKIRGYRIELQEIEAALASCEPVREAVVQVVRVAGQQPALAAYVAWRDGEADGATRAAFDAHLASRLPHYMRPAFVVTLARLPRTLNGKVDRRALPAVDMTSPPAAEEATLADGLEAALAQVWGDVLGTLPRTPAAHFVELGGNSLSAVQLRAAVRRRFGVDFPLAALLVMPVLGEQAALLAELVRQADPAAAGASTELEEIEL